MVNRYYTPTSAEFLSVDPELSETHEPYAFANGDPLNESDPLGLKGWYCVKTYNGTPGYSSHYFQKTKYGPPNGKCDTFLSWLSYQTQTTINYYEFIAGLSAWSQPLTVWAGGLTPPLPVASPSSPPSPGLFESIGHAVSSAADDVGHAASKAGSWVATQFKPRQITPIHNIIHNSVGFGGCAGGAITGFGAGALVGVGEGPGAAAGCVAGWNFATTTGPGVTTILPPPPPAAVVR